LKGYKRVVFGVPKKLSNLTKTNPRKKADVIAQNHQSKKYFGACSR